MASHHSSPWCNMVDHGEGGSQRTKEEQGRPPAGRKVVFGLARETSHQELSGNTRKKQQVASGTSDGPDQERRKEQRRQYLQQVRPVPETEHFQTTCLHFGDTDALQGAPLVVFLKRYASGVGWTCWGYCLFCSWRRDPVICLFQRLPYDVFKFHLRVLDGKSLEQGHEPLVACGRTNFLSPSPLSAPFVAYVTKERPSKVGLSRPCSRTKSLELRSSEIVPSAIHSQKLAKTLPRCNLARCGEARC